MLSCTQDRPELRRLVGRRLVARRLVGRRQWVARREACRHQEVREFQLFENSPLRLSFF